MIDQKLLSIWKLAMSSDHENAKPSPTLNRRAFQACVASTALVASVGTTQALGSQSTDPSTPSAAPFGPDFPNLDSLATGEWWKKRAVGRNAPPSLVVPREEVIAFALYAHDAGVLKLTAQLFPLYPDEPHDVRLELRQDDAWVEVARVTVTMPGWSAHFRIENWDATQNVPYRVRHGEQAEFTGLIRRDPSDQDVIVVASMSCNSSRTTGLRPEILENLKLHNPDLLFFAGDQTYRHTEHTAGWIEFGLQFRDICRDRPTVTIPDDHDVGHPNLWGEGGKQSLRKDGADGGYFYPVPYVNMVQRQQTWHLPDPTDATPALRGITVYFTRLRVGGIDFAILEDRKFKSGPAGKIPQLGSRPDHIQDPAYDPRTIDLPGLSLLGERQEAWLKSWTEDWTGAQCKVALSQTAFCGAVHMHGARTARLLADLDCNGWPQAGRRRALQLLRQAHAVHLCGDQHLAVVVKHGLDQFGDGPYGFTSPALVNTIYGRWWHPIDEQPGPRPVPHSPLPWTGDFLDGLGNRISMLAYANPVDVNDERQRADGYGLIRFDKRQRTITFECWPRFADAKVDQPFPGWPMTIGFAENDGRVPTGWLPELIFDDAERPVVQVAAEPAGEVIYTVRVASSRFQPPVYAPGQYSIRIGRNRPDGPLLSQLSPQAKTSAGTRRITLSSP